MFIYSTQYTVCTVSSPFLSQYLHRLRGHDEYTKRLRKYTDFDISLPHKSHKFYKNLFIFGLYIWLNLFEFLLLHLESMAKFCFFLQLSWHISSLTKIFLVLPVWVYCRWIVGEEGAIGEVLLVWTLPFGRWLSFSSFHLADPVLEHFCASTIPSQAALNQLQI